MDLVTVKFEFGKTIDWDNLIDYAQESSERNFANKSKFWGAIISNYKTAKVMDRDFITCSFDSEVFLIDMGKVVENDILQLRYDKRISGKYTDRFEINALVKGINDIEIELLIFESLFKTVKYKNDNFN